MMLEVREMESTMPICASSITRELPPELKNGRLMPVLGSRSVITRMLRITCSPTCEVRPTPKSVPNLSFAFMDMVMPLQTSSAKIPSIMTAPISPSSSQTIANTKSFCGSGR